MTYLWLNVVFLVAVCVFWIIAMAAHGRRAGRRIAAGELTATPRPGRRLAALFLTLAVLLVLTAIFDNLIVGFGIVSYDEAKISGALVGVAPLEDFAYTVAAVCALPALWVLLPAKESR
jgi:lycopene cyclase domain-containing protein